jgi:hypothetical protein
MRSPSPRCAAALVCLSLFSVACATDSPDPTEPNLAATVTSSFEVVESDFTFNPRGCASEEIAFHFRTAFRVQEVSANDRRFIQSIQIVERGSYGVGVETGTLYRLAGGQHETFTTGENGSFTSVTFQHFASQGPGGNFTVRVQIHFTLTPSGDVTADIFRLEPGC